MPSEVKKKYGVGFLVGRFQPFHKGHLQLIKKSLQQVEQIIIGIGSVGKLDKDNILSYSQRLRIIRKIIKKEDLKDSVIKIVPLKDFNNDKLWLDHSLKQVGKFDVVIGNNEWTNGIFEKAGYPVLRLGFYKRYLYEGLKIRKLIAEGKDWKCRVPEQIVKLLDGYIARKKV